MHEILPRCGPVPALTSPALRGELSRRSPSELAVQKMRPARTGLVGNSNGASLRRSVAAAGGFRNSSVC
jgi:hypothetical protein